MADITDFGKVDWTFVDEFSVQREKKLNEYWEQFKKPEDSKCPTSNSTLKDLKRTEHNLGETGLAYSNGVVSDENGNSCPTKEMEKVSIGPIPESEEQNAKAWYGIFESLKTVECRLDPRLNHKDGEPYDPIDLTFRIIDAIKTLKGIRSKIADRFCFTEPSLHRYS